MSALHRVCTVDLELVVWVTVHTVCTVHVRVSFSEERGRWGVRSR